MKLLPLFIIIVFYSVVDAQTSTLKILDENQQPIPLAHIAIIESNKLLLTDIDGKVQIDFGKNEKLTVEVSFIGYVTQQKVLKPNQQVKVILEEDVVFLNSFVITGQYAENNPEKAVQKITIIDKEKIDKMGAVNLTDILQNETNIRLTQDGILGSSMSLQGISGENVKIMIDGIAVIGKQDGSIDLSQLNLNDVERIEIVEGPMSVNYGADALAGVVNIITKTPSKQGLNFSLNSYYENVGKYNLDGSVSQAFGNHVISVGLGRNYFDGWKETDPLFKENEPIADSTRFKTWKPKEQYFGKFKYQYQQKNTSVIYTLSAFDEKITNRGTPRLPYYETAFDDYYNTQRIDNSVQFKTKFNKQKQIDFLAAYNYFERVKNTFFKDLTTLNEVLTTNPSDQDTSGFDLITIRTFFANANDSIKVNYQIGIDLNRETAEGVRIESNTKQIGDYAAFASLEYKPFQSTIIRPGIRYAYNTEYEAPILPSINVKQTFKKINIRASYAKGFRAPSLKELYFNFVDVNHNIVGNNNLLAETSNNFNLAVNYSTLKKAFLLKVEVASFYNKIDDLITLAQITGTEYSYVNVGSFSTNGIQFNGNVSYNHFMMGIGVSYIGRENMISSLSDVDEYSYSPEYKINMNYEVKKWKSFIALFYKYNGKLTSFAINGNNEVYQTYINPYQMADLSIGKKFFKKLAITIGSKNIFDVKNVDAITTGGTHSGGGGNSMIAMGRTYFVKLNLNFNYDKK